MTENIDGDFEFEDVTPNPRILAMLGRIPFEPWQCLAELIDNSIDALLSAQEENPNWILDELGGDNFPINITLPSQSDLDFGRGVVTVIDRGPGMTLSQLKSAVKAGFSGNDPTNKLGLFGMGFNIATAKLGKVTTVTTARKEDENWTCLKIDFDEMMRTGKFQAKRWVEPKDGAYPDEEHGTIVEISSLDRQECRPLVHARGTIKKKLGKVYSNIIEDKSVIIRLNDDQEIIPRKHCTWSPSRFVSTTTFGRVNAIITIDKTLPSESFCKACWGWCPNDSVMDGNCPNCGINGQTIERNRRIHGWVGIQRYLDQDDFGIDLIRNGRVIEQLSKDFFSWTNSEGIKELEYPIDTTHWGGRIVGEIHLDFIGVTYTKNSFDKTQYNWNHAVEIIRGNTPLRPQIARRNNLPINESPLGKLFAGYRKANPPGTKHLVPGNPSSPNEGDNATAKRWAQNFSNGDEEYQTDQKWYDLVLAADRARRTTPIVAGTEDTGDDDINPGSPFGTIDEENDDENDDEQYLVLDTGLSQSYQIRPAGTAPIQVRAYEDTRRLTNRELTLLPPIVSEYIQAGDAKLIFHKKHPALLNFSEDILDYILMELAAQFSIRAGRGSEWSVTRCYSHLKETYQSDSKLDVQALASHSSTIVSELREHLAAANLSSSRENLSSAEIETLEDRVFQTLSAGPETVDELLENGEFIQYMDNKYLIKCFEENPEISMDGNFFSMPFNSLNERLREQAVSELSRCLKDAVNVIDVGQSNAPRDKLWLMRTKASIAYLNDQVV